jgi:hypothetical protein
LKRFCRSSVDEKEVHDLGGLALIVGYLIEGNCSDLAGCEPVQVRAIPECLLHGSIS